MERNNYLRDQAIALSLTVVTFLVLISLVWVEIMLLNTTVSHKISLAIRPVDVLIGMTIYLKTSIDFAIFIAQLMEKNPGLKGRIGIEIGTAFGNGVGTMAILAIWAFFSEIDWLLALMIVLASLVLLHLAQSTLEEVEERGRGMRSLTSPLIATLRRINNFTEPVLSKIIPTQSIRIEHKKTLFALLAMSFTVPFILGMDGFAGYVPIFEIVNVWGFVVGALLGHMLLNIALYISPKRTVKVIKNPIIAVLGGIVFIFLAGWGFYEAISIFIK
jgi:hypothetical protein